MTKKAAYLSVLVFLISILLVSCKGDLEVNEPMAVMETATNITVTIQPIFTATPAPANTPTPIPTKEQISVNNFDRLEVVEEMYTNRSEKLYSMALSPSGKYLAVGEFDDRAEGTASIYLYATTEAGLMPIAPIRDAHEKTIRGLDFSADDKYLASVSWDYTVRIWDIETLSLVQEFDGALSDSYETQSKVSWQKDVFVVEFSPDGKYLAAAMSGNQIKLWNMADFSLEKEWLAHTSYITALEFSSDSSVLLSGSADKTIRVWNVETMELIQFLSGHVGTITDIGFFPNEKRVYSAGDRTVRIWDLFEGGIAEGDVAQGEIIAVLAGHEGVVYGVDVSPDGRKLISVGESSDVFLWDAENFEEISRSNDYEDFQGLLGVAFSADGNHAYSVSFERSGIFYWDIEGGFLNGRNVVPSPVFFNGMSFLPESHIFSLRGWYRFSLFDVDDEIELLRVVGLPEGLENKSFARDIMFLSQKNEKRLDFIDAFTGKTQQSIADYQVRGIVRDISFDNTILAVTENTTIHLVDAVTGEVLQDLKGHSQAANTLANEQIYYAIFSPDGKYLASIGRDTSVRVWDVATGENIYTYLGFRIPQIVFSSDSKKMAITDQGWVFADTSYDQDNHVSVLRLKMGQKLQLFRSWKMNNVRCWMFLFPQTAQFWLSPAVTI